MGSQSKTNRARRENQATKAAHEVYVEGIGRASQILAWIQDHHQEPFAVGIQVTESATTLIEDDSFFTVAATPEEFEAKRGFVEAVATAAMSQGILVVIDAANRQTILNGQGAVRAWLLSGDAGAQPLPVKPGVTEQLQKDMPFLAHCEHVQAAEMAFANPGPPEISPASLS